MIAADGAHSPVRRALGVQMTGRGDFAQCFTIYFRADVRELLRERNLSVVYVNQPGLLAFFRFSITADAGFLAVFRTDDAGAGHDEARCAGLVRAALGVAEDYPVEIENVQLWTAAADTAATFRQDRVFLAGDAAHVMPPTGGFGGNTGVADVHNLAWKLAMVLDGRAGPALLDSYDAERRPIARLTVEQAYRRYVERVDPTLPSTDLAPALDDTAIELGAVYRSCAVIGDDADEALVEAPEHPSGRPGTRLPHAWIDEDGARVSTLDLAGGGRAAGLAGARDSRAGRPGGRGPHPAGRAPDPPRRRDRLAQPARRARSGSRPGGSGAPIERALKRDVELSGIADDWPGNPGASGRPGPEGAIGHARPPRPVQAVSAVSIAPRTLLASAPFNSNPGSSSATATAISAYAVMYTTRSLGRRSIAIRATETPLGVPGGKRRSVTRTSMVALDSTAFKAPTQSVKIVTSCPAFVTRFSMT